MRQQEHEHRHSRGCHRAGQAAQEVLLVQPATLGASHLLDTPVQREALMQEGDRLCLVVKGGGQAVESAGLEAAQAPKAVAGRSVGRPLPLWE